MYCKHCGQKLPEVSKFCAKCGTPVSTGKGKAAANVQRKGKAGMTICIIAAVLIFGIVMLLNYLQTCIDPTEYVTVSASGFSGGGTVEVRFDEYELLEKKIAGSDPRENQWSESFLENPDPLRAFSELFFEEEEESVLEGIFSISVKQDEILNGNFKNGDSVTIDIYVDRDSLKEYGFHTWKEEYHAEFVIGEDTPPLAEPADIDIFEYLDIKIMGDDGNGRLVPQGTGGVFELQEPVNNISTVKIEIIPRDDGYIATIRLEMLDAAGKKLYSGGVGVVATPAAGLREGDQSVVTFYELDWVLEKGIGFLETEKTFVAENLSEADRLNVFQYLQPVFSGKNGEGTVTWTLSKDQVGSVGAVTDISLELQPGSYSGQTLLVVCGKNTQGNDLQCTFEICTPAAAVIQNGSELSAYLAEKGRTSAEFRSMGVLFATSGSYQISGLK